MTVTRSREIAAVLQTLRLLGAHATSITGNRTSSVAIVHEALTRHPRPSSGIDPRTLHAILRDVTDTCRTEPAGNDFSTAFGGEFTALPFEAKACISLRINFDLGFSDIGPIISMSGRAAETLYAAAIGRLEQADGAPVTVARLRGT